MPGTTPRDVEVNGTIEESLHSSDSSEDLANTSDSNQKWEDADQIVGAQTKNISDANPAQSGDSSEDDSSEESMMTVNGSVDEQIPTVAAQNHETNVNGSNDKENHNESSVSQEDFGSGGDKEDPTQCSENKSQDESQGSVNGKGEEVLEINSDSESDTRQPNEEDDSDSESEDDDDSSEESVSDEEGSKPNGNVVNDDAVSIQDSEDEESSQDRVSNTGSKTNNMNPEESCDPLSPTVLSDSEDDEEFGNNQRSDQDESDVEEVGMWNDVKQPIVVNDTKKLADLAAKVTGQKEPTVVIINTEGDSNKNKELSLPTQEQITLNSIYCNIAARGTTVTPVVKQAIPAAVNLTAVTQSTNILPSLTDDMYVVEAPSFIVPYVYEKPPITAFREYIDALKKELDANPSNQDTADVVDDDVNMGLSSLKDLELAAQKEAASRKRRIRKPKDDDDSWDAMSTDSEDLSDEDRPKTIVIKEKGDDSIDVALATSVTTEPKDSKPKLDGSFESPLGSFFLNLGMNLVQEHVQKDLLKQQKRKLYKENKTSTGNPKQTEAAITSLMKNIESSSKKNEAYKFQMKKCSFCSFQSESSIVLSHHSETPHMRNNVYKCNFCVFEVKSPHDILFHMEAEHNVRGRLERAPAYHQCANCQFEDNGKGRLARHLVSCAKKYRQDSNLLPPVEWELPAKIPKVITRGRPPTTVYKPVLSSTPPLMAKPLQSNGAPNSSVNAALMRARGRPVGPLIPPANQRATIGMPQMRNAQMLFKNNQFLQNNFQLLQGGQTTIRPNTSGGAVVPKTVHQPSISITPLPRVTHAPSGLPPHIASSNNKATFVICEICDGYIKDLEQLRNHMMWIHKVKIHPKMIYNRPPLNCQKCQFRFFTDQGLERHLLGSHGLVTSSMQEAANKGKDAGRCPACGRVYQWKLLNHVARDHNMTLKPAHLSYKCTVCAATFGMYKQFENHVYSAHSVVARRVTEKTSKVSEPSTNASVSVTAISSSGITKLSSLSTENILRPLRINDEITIIPQPSRLKTESPDMSN